MSTNKDGILLSACSNCIKPFVDPSKVESFKLPIQSVSNLLSTNEGGILTSCPNYVKSSVDLQRWNFNYMLKFSCIEMKFLENSGTEQTCEHFSTVLFQETKAEV